MKKFRAKIALILVLSLALAAAIPALAAQTTKITGKYEAPAIEVVIPTTGQAVINPFGLPVAVTADDGKTNIGYVGENNTVVTRPLVGYNASTFDLQVSASVVGTPKGELTLDGQANPTTKASVIEFQVKQNDYETSDDTWYYDAATAKTKKAETVSQLKGALVVGALNAWADGEGESVTVGTDPAEMQPVTIDKGVEKTVSGKTTIQPAPTSIFFARLNGEVAKKPVDEDGNKVEWTTKDGVDVTISWTIEMAQS